MQGLEEVGNHSSRK